MNRDQIRQLMEACYKQVWELMDAQRIPTFYAPEITGFINGTPFVYRDLFDALEYTRASYKDVQYTIHELCVEGDHAALVVNVKSYDLKNQKEHYTTNAMFIHFKDKKIDKLRIFCSPPIEP